MLTTDAPMEIESNKAIVELSNKAVERAKSLLAKADDDVIGLRLRLSNKGCSGHEYVIEYAHDKKQFEEMVEKEGMCLLIDPAAVMFVIGTYIDYEEGLLQSGFTFSNPNEMARCGCGLSVSF